MMTVMMPNRLASVVALCCWLPIVQLMASLAAASSPPFQPMPNRQCVQLMAAVGADTVLYQVPSNNDSSLLRDRCSQACSGDCYGFNWPPSRQFCQLVTQGCSLTSATLWTFYRRPKQQLQQQQIAARPDRVLAVEPTANSRLLSSPITVAVVRSAVVDPPGQTTLGQHFDVFRGRICKAVSLQAVQFVASSAVGCAEQCLLANTTCGGFNVLTVDDTLSSAEQPSGNRSFCELLFDDDCQLTVDNNWYYVRRKPVVPANSSSVAAPVQSTTALSSTMSTPVITTTTTTTAVVTVNTGVVIDAVVETTVRQTSSSSATTTVTTTTTAMSTMANRINETVREAAVAIAVMPTSTTGGMTTTAIMAKSSNGGRLSMTPFLLLVVLIINNNN